MVRIVAIENLGDPAVSDYVGLRDVNLRKLIETERGIYIAEGEKVIRRAMAAGHRPRSFLLTQRWLNDLTDVVEDLAAEAFVASEDLIESVTGFHVHRGALGAFERPLPLSIEQLLENASKIFVIEDVTDHANVGAIFRNAAGLGFDAIVLAPRAADPFYRRAIKVSMGAVFALPFARAEDWAGIPDLLTANGFTSIALCLDEDAVDFETIAPTGKIAVLLGSEGHGLSGNWLRGADIKAKIEMRNQIDSLNVAATSAIAAWHLRNY